MREALEMALLAFAVVDLALIGAALAVAVLRVTGVGPGQRVSREEREEARQRAAEHGRVGRIQV